MRRWLAVVATSSLVAGCGRSDREWLEGVVVRSAELRQAETARVAFIGGVVRGNAVLALVDDADQERTFDVELRGSLLGLMYELSGDPGWHGAVPIDLAGVEGPVTGDRLLGRYRGRAASVTAGFGIASRTLRNREGAQIDHAWFTIGVSAFVGWEWLRMRPADEADEADEADGSDEADSDPGER